MGIGGGGGGGGGTQADKPKINDATAAYRIEYFIAQPPSVLSKMGLSLPAFNVWLWRPSINERQAADLLNIKVPTLRRWRWAGKGPHVVAPERVSSGPITPSARLALTS
jgi:hypothetical protein